MVFRGLEKQRMLAGGRSCNFSSPPPELIPIVGRFGAATGEANQARFNLETEMNIGTGLGAACIVPPAATISINPKWE